MNFESVYLICTRLERNRAALRVLDSVPPDTLSNQQKKEWAAAVKKLNELCIVLEEQMDDVRKECAK